MSQADLIPYTIEARPETGLYNAKLGMWLFLASEVMLFGSLFSSYILLRTSALQWPVQSDIVSVPIGTINTILMISSSMTMVTATSWLKRNDFTKFKKFLGITIALAVGFLFFKGLEYAEHISHHETPEKSIFLALYYLMTGLHGLHIMGGIIANSYLLGAGSRMWNDQPQRYLHRVEVVGLYWNFVDIVWIFILITVYLL